MNEKDKKILEESRKRLENSKFKPVLNKPNFDAFDKLLEDISKIECKYKVGYDCSYGKQYNPYNRFNNTLRRCTKPKGICPKEVEETRLKKEEDEITLVKLLERVRVLEKRVNELDGRTIGSIRFGG